MAVNPSLDTIGSGYNLAKINSNFTKVAAAFQDVVSISGTLPNAMNADFDLNSNDVLNGGVGNFQNLFINGTDVHNLVGFTGPAGVSFTWKGVYSGATAYVLNDVVSDQGSSWIAITFTTGHAPPTLPTTSNTWWNLAASIGATGAAGAGSGDVVGPSSSIDSEIALFNSTTGKLIKRATQTGILKGTSGVIGTATAGTDYYNPGGTDVAVADGGTNFSSYTVGDIIYASGSTTLSKLSKGTALQVLRQNAALTAPEWSTAREVLTTNRTYYVRTDGSDSNSGLANTAGGAFLTIQKAIDVSASLDIGIYTVIINVGAGTYSAGIICKSHNSANAISIIGDTATPSNVLVSVANPATGGSIFGNGVVGQYNISGMKLVVTGSVGFSVYATNSTIIVLADIEFGAVPSGYSHVLSTINSSISIGNGAGHYKISAGAAVHWQATYGGLLFAAGLTVTITGTPAFTGAFCQATNLSSQVINGNTFSGSATGIRYTGSSLSVIDTGGGGASYIPGNSAGSTATGAQYI